MTSTPRPAFTELSRRILVGCRALGSEVRIDVYDTGIGIAPARLSRIFDAFERLDASRCEGLGIGLFVVRRVEADRASVFLVYPAASGPHTRRGRLGACRPGRKADRLYSGGPVVEADAVGSEESDHAAQGSSGNKAHLVASVHHRWRCLFWVASWKDGRFSSGMAGIYFAIAPVRSKSPTISSHCVD
jgi:Histidine kinase-, DNA gyrase B-, and HSP90-like ATPase